MYDNFFSMASIFRDISYLLSSKFFTIVLSFGLSVLLVNLMSLNDYGSYIIIISFVALLQTVSDLGFSESVRYFTARYSNNKKIIAKYVITGIRFISIISLLSMLLVILLSKSLGSFYKIQSFLFIISALYVFTSTVFSSFLTMFTGLGRFKEQSITNIFFALARFFTVVFLILNLRVVGVLFGEILATIIGVAFAIFFMRDLIRDFRKVNVRETIKTGKTIGNLAGKYAISIFLTTFISNISNLVLGIFSLSFTAIFSIATKFSTVLSSMGSNVSVAMFPRVVTKLQKKESLDEYISVYSRYVLIGTLLFSIAFIPFSKEVVGLFFSSRSLGVVNILPFLFLAVSFDSSLYIITLLFNANKEPKYNIYIGLFKGIITVLSLAILVPMFFDVGAGIATLIVTVAGGYFSVFLAKRMTHIDANMKSLTMIMILGILAVGLSYILINYSFLYRVLLTIFNIGVFVCIMLAFRQVKISEVKPIAKRVLLNRRRRIVF